MTGIREAQRAVSRPDCVLAGECVMLNQEDKNRFAAVGLGFLYEYEGKSAFTDETNVLTLWPNGAIQVSGPYDEGATLSPEQWLVIAEWLQRNRLV